MSAAARHPDKTLRLATLRAMGALDTRAEPLFDALVRSAAAASGRALALIVLVDADGHGLAVHAPAPDIDEPSVLRVLAKASSGVLEIPDARVDPRCADDPLVVGAAGIRCFVAVPIRRGESAKAGALCVLDRAPGTLDERQHETLRQLARAVAQALETRPVARRNNLVPVGAAPSLQPPLESAGETERKRRANEALLERTGRLLDAGGWELDLATNAITWSDQTCRLHDVPPGFHPSLEEAVSFYDAVARPVIDAAVRKSIDTGEGWDLQLPLTTATGRKIWVRAVGILECAEDGTPQRLVGAFQDITLQRRAILALEASDRRYRKLFQYSPGLICTHDHEGVLLSVNPAAARSLGYSVGEMIGRPLTDFMRPERRPYFAEYLLRLLPRCFAAALMLVFLAAAPPARAVEPFVIKDIRIEGLQRGDPGTVFGALPFRIGDTYTDDKGATALRALFATGLFKDVRIEIEGEVVVVVIDDQNSACGHGG